ncbi:hypothetical protein FIBSPDRAFT_898644, partial [Athelia psychrophila]
PPPPALAATPPAAPRAAALPSQASQAPRSIYNRPAEPTGQRAPARDNSRPAREGYRGAAFESHNMSYKRSRSPPPAVEYPQKKRFIDPPVAQAPTLPPPARSSLCQITHLSYIILLIVGREQQESLTSPGEVMGRARGFGGRNAYCVLGSGMSSCLGSKLGGGLEEGREAAVGDRLLDLFSRLHFLRRHSRRLLARHPRTVVCVLFYDLRLRDQPLLGTPMQ